MYLFYDFWGYPTSSHILSVITLCILMVKLHISSVIRKPNTPFIPYIIEVQNNPVCFRIVHQNESGCIAITALQPVCNAITTAYKTPEHNNNFGNEFATNESAMKTYRLSSPRRVCLGHDLREYLFATKTYPCPNARLPADCVVMSF